MSQFPAANIYSLISGFYPILSDTVITKYSQNNDYRQGKALAPSMYDMVGGIKTRSPYLQGNKLVYTDAGGDVANISVAQEEQILDRTQPEFYIRAEQLQRDAQVSFTGDIVEDATTTQAAINRSGASGSIEEQFQQGRYVSPRGDTYGAQRFDFYDTELDRHVNVTIRDVAQGGHHGIYGSLGGHLEEQVKQIRTMMMNNEMTDKEGYDAIIQQGINYFRTRAESTWNPLIRHSRNAVRQGPIARLFKGKTEQARMRSAVGSLAPVAIGGLKDLNTHGFTSYASQGSKTMLLQHLGNEATYNDGAMETMPIDTYVHGFFGPFKMYGPNNKTQAYEYKVDEIDGYWYPGYFATLHEDKEILRGVSGRTEEAQLTMKAGVNASHRAGGTVIDMAGTTSVAMGGFTAQARRLYPEVNIHHAKEQFSDRIHALIRDMQDVETIPPELMSIINFHQRKFSGEFYSGKQLWAAPYVGFIGQQYAAGANIGS